MKRAKRKQKPRKLNKQSSNSVLKQKKISSPYVNTLIIMLGMYIPHLLLAISKGEVVDAFITNNSKYGGLIVNFLIILAAAYSRFSDEYFLHRKVYWLSFFAFCIAIAIHAQANAYLSPNFSLVYDALESPCMALVLQVLFVMLIFALYKQKCWHVTMKYNKIIIK